MLQLGVRLYILKINMLKVELKTANAKESGRPYEYISISYEETEVTRIFIKSTEKEFFTKMLGNYNRSTK